MLYWKQQGGKKMTADESLLTSHEDEALNVEGFSEALDEEAFVEAMNKENAMPNPTAEYETFPTIDFPLKSKLIHDLQALPEAINSKTKIIYEDRKHYNELELAMRLAEQRTMAEVTAETTPEGKKKHSNAELRQIECDNRLAGNNDYNATKRTAEKLKEEIDLNSIELEFLNNNFKAARAMALLVGND